MLGVVRVGLGPDDPHDLQVHGVFQQLVLVHRPVLQVGEGAVLVFQVVVAGGHQGEGVVQHVGVVQPEPRGLAVCGDLVLRLAVLVGR